MIAGHLHFVAGQPPCVLATGTARLPPSQIRQPLLRCREHEEVEPRPARKEGRKGGKLEPRPWCAVPRPWGGILAPKPQQGWAWTDAATPGLTNSPRFRTCLGRMLHHVKVPNLSRMQIVPTFIWCNILPTVVYLHCNTIPSHHMQHLYATPYRHITCNTYIYIYKLKKLCATVLSYFQSGPVGTQGPRDSKATTQNSHTLLFTWGFAVGI